MDKKPSDQKASEAATEAHSPDRETRKEAMATLRDRKGSGGASSKEEPAQKK